MSQGHSSYLVPEKKLGKTDSKNINISQFNILRKKTLYNTPSLYMLFLCPTVPLSQIFGTEQNTDHMFSCCGTVGHKKNMYN